MTRTDTDVTVDELADEAIRLADPVERLAALQQVHPLAEQLLRRVRDAREDAALEANRSGVTQARLSAEVGLSLPATQKLIHKATHRPTGPT